MRVDSVAWFDLSLFISILDANLVIVWWTGTPSFELELPIIMFCEKMRHSWVISVCTVTTSASYQLHILASYRKEFGFVTICSTRRNFSPLFANDMKHFAILFVPTFTERGLLQLVASRALLVSLSSEKTGEEKLFTLAFDLKRWKLIKAFISSF